MTNDLWDIDAGYLSAQQLNESLRNLGSLLGAGQPADPKAMPVRWRGHRDALVIRYNQLLEELALRQMTAPGPLPVTEETILWPVSYSLSPSAQLVEIRGLNEQGQRGRIQAPQSEHELWAQYKYSVLARNQDAYRDFGQRVATRAIPREELALELVNSARATPTAGGLRNAVYHLWGYVSAHSSLNPNQLDLVTLLREIQQLALANNVTYLVNSTALGELAYWCRYYTQLEAAKAKPGGR